MKYTQDEGIRQSKGRKDLATYYEQQKGMQNRNCQTFEAAMRK